METIDIPTIERRARQLRAEEMRRLEGVVAERLRLYVLLMGHSLLSLVETVGELVRPLFSWNPQDQSAKPAGPSVLNHLNNGARALFSWNPRKSHGV